MCRGKSFNEPTLIAVERHVGKQGVNESSKPWPAFAHAAGAEIFDRNVDVSKLEVNTVRSRLGRRHHFYRRFFRTRHRLVTGIAPGHVLSLITRTRFRRHILHDEVVTA